MTNNNPSLRATVEGQEHRPEYALSNARAFVEMTESAADVFEISYDDLRIENDCTGHGFTGHYFIFEEDGDLHSESIHNSPEFDDYNFSQNSEESAEERDWRTNMPLTDFEESLESIASDPDKTFHGLSRGLDYRLESSSPPGMMEGFGGPTPKPQSYGDAVMYVSSRDNEFRALFKAAPNSGAEIQPSFIERTVAALKSGVLDKETDDILIENNQSGREPYAELNFIEGNELESGMGQVGTDVVEDAAAEAEGFDIEAI